MTSRFLGYSASFIGGMLFVFVVYAAWCVVFYLAIGSEIRSSAGSTGHHFARLYSRGGFGDQTYNLVVDGKWVYRSPDEAPGNQHESLTWNEAGTVITVSNDDGLICQYDSEVMREIQE